MHGERRACTGRLKKIPLANIGKARRGEEPATTVAAAALEPPAKRPGDHTTTATALVTSPPLALCKPLKT